MTWTRPSSIRSPAGDGGEHGLASPAGNSGEHGFTLVEMLVAMVSGIVVIIATLSILDISIGESARISERVDANQRGRLAMEKVLQDLHSSCIAAGITPVEPGSEENKLKLISQTGSETYFPNVTEHVISFSKTLHTLTDESYISVGEQKEKGVWVFPESPASKQTLLTGVWQTMEGVSPAETPVPVFKYYKYEGGGLSRTALPTPLTLENANETAEVSVSFRTAPSTERTQGDRMVDLSDTAVLRFDPASATGSNTPCG